jgi:hypothetical protein
MTDGPPSVNRNPTQSALESRSAVGFDIIEDQSLSWHAGEEVGLTVLGHGSSPGHNSLVDSVYSNRHFDDSRRGIEAQELAERQTVDLTAIHLNGNAPYSGVTSLIRAYLASRPSSHRKCSCELRHNHRLTNALFAASSASTTCRMPHPRR